MIIHEPVTLLTDYLLTLLGGYLAWRLYRHPSISIPSVRWWFRGLLVLALSAFVGGSYHGFVPNFPEIVDAVWWRLVLWIMCLLGFTMGSALVCEMVSSEKQKMWKNLLIAKFLIATVAVMIFPQFLIAIVDYGSAMLAWGVAAIFIKRPWRTPILAAVGLSVLAAWVQVSGFSLSQHMNHNDIFHLIQGLAIIGFYRAATRMSEFPIRSDIS